LEFFRRNPKDFLSRLLTMDETWLYQYDTDQSNNQWSGGIAAHPAPKNSECKNPLQYQRGVLFISAGAIEGYFEGQTPREGHQVCLVLAQSPGSPSTCNPEKTGLPELPVS